MMAPIGGMMLCASIFLLSPRTALAEINIAEMMHGCEVVTDLGSSNNKNANDLELAGECLGVVQGVAEEQDGTLFCLPKNALYKDVITNIWPTLQKELKRYTGRRTHFYDLLVLSLAEKYPCNHSGYVVVR